MQKGIVLIVVLVFLQIFILLSLYAAQCCFFENKISLNHWVTEHEFSLAENQLALIEGQLLNQQCIISPISQVELLTEKFSWWKTLACHEYHKKYHYFYVIADLGVDPCARVAKKKIAHYYQVNLLLMNEKNAPLLIQSSYILPEESSERCRLIAHDAQSGRQMWCKLRYNHKLNENS